MINVEKEIGGKVLSLQTGKIPIMKEDKKQENQQNG